MKQLRVLLKREYVTPVGNWNSAKDWFPVIDINQETGTVNVTWFETMGYQKKASILTERLDVETKGDSSFIRGEVKCSNWVHGKCSGAQQFCFAIFQGDSGHIYIHRAPATKGWMNAKPQEIKKRLRKLGIGVEDVAYQQGDFLLKRVNGKAYPDEVFIHETMGAGHHKFDAPVLYSSMDGSRQYWIKENVTLTHHAVDGIQHPTLVIEPGKYVVGTTTNSLSHPNKRD